MASIRIDINLDDFSNEMRRKFQELKNPEFLLRPVCFDLLDLMKKRIHNKGLDSSEQPIGSYKESYLKLRVEKYGRTEDDKIILSLTSKLENDWAVIESGEKSYGVGFLTDTSLKKARWAEENKDKIIFSLSKKELDYASESFSDYVKKVLES